MLLSLQPSNLLAAPLPPVRWCSGLARAAGPASDVLWTVTKGKKPVDGSSNLATTLCRVQYALLQRVLEGSCSQQGVVVLLRWSNRRSDSPRSVFFLKDFFWKSPVVLEDALLLRLPGYSTELRRRQR